MEPFNRHAEMEKVVGLAKAFSTSAALGGVELQHKNHNVRKKLRGSCEDVAR